MNLRLFIALTVPEEVRGRMMRAQAAFRTALARSRAAWTRPEQFHLTVRFLGDVEESRTEELLVAVRGAAAGFRPLEVRAAGTGCFPNARAPRVLWVGVRDLADCLPDLHRAVLAATTPFAETAKAEAFSGHVTLGRIKQLQRPEAAALSALLQDYAGQAFGEWTAGSLELMRSELAPAGAQHSLLARVPFLQTRGEMAGPPAGTPRP